MGIVWMRLKEEPTPPEGVKAWVTLMEGEMYPSVHGVWREGAWRRANGQPIPQERVFHWTPIWRTARVQQKKSPQRNHATFRRDKNGKRWVHTQTLMGFRPDLIHHKDRKQFRKANSRFSRYQSHRLVRPRTWGIRVSWGGSMVLNSEFAVRIHSASVTGNS